jgi:hypothetical protein
MEPVLTFLIALLVGAGDVVLHQELPAAILPESFAKRHSWKLYPVFLNQFVRAGTILERTVEASFAAFTTHIIGRFCCNSS